MNEDGSSIVRTPQLTCSSILLRAVSYPDFILKNGGISPKAFHLRKESEQRPREETLSLIIKDAISLVDAFTTILRECYGIYSLHTGLILDSNLLDKVKEHGIHLDLEGEIKGDDPRMIWARIRNMPHRSDNKLAAELIADLLAEQARRVQPPDEVEMTPKGARLKTNG